MSITEKLRAGWPDAEWNIPGGEGSEYDRLDWLSGGAKPTLAQIEEVAIEPVSELAPLTARQFRLGLHAKGLLASVQSTIDALDEPERTAAQIEWEYATQIERDHPLVASLADQLDLTDEQIDDMWRAALAL